MKTLGHWWHRRRFEIVVSRPEQLRETVQVRAESESSAVRLARAAGYQVLSSRWGETQFGAARDIRFGVWTAVKARFCGVVVSLATRFRTDSREDVELAAGIRRRQQLERKAEVERNARGRL